MSSLVRRSRKLAARAALLCSGGVLIACEFPNYAFPSDRANASGVNGGTSTIPEGGTTAAGSSSGGAGVGGSAADGGANGGASASAGSTNGGASASGGVEIGVAGEGGAPGGSGGGLLFSDDFESGQAASWTPSAPSEWSVVSSGSNHVYKEGTKVDDLCVSSAGSSDWTDQVLEAKIDVLAFGGSTTSDLAFLAVRFRDPDNFYYAALRSDGKVVLKARLNGSDGSLGASVSSGVKTGTWYDVKVAAIGENLSVYVDGMLVQSVSGVLIASGAIALGTNNATAEFDDVTVTSP